MVKGRWVRLGRSVNSGDPRARDGSSRDESVTSIYARKDRMTRRQAEMYRKITEVM